MKKVLCFMAFAVLAVFSLAIVSCGEDDGDANDGGNMSIIGTWKCDLTEKGKHIVDGYYGVEDFHEYYYHQFKEDGTCIDVSISYFKYSEEFLLAANICKIMSYLPSANGFEAAECFRVRAHATVNGNGLVFAAAYEFENRLRAYVAEPARYHHFFESAHSYFLMNFSDFHTIFSLN